MSEPFAEDSRYNVTIYLPGDRVETYEDVSATRAKELEDAFGVDSPNAAIVHVRQV